MARIEGKLRVGVPAELAYELWSRPQEFPNFMAAVTSVKAKGKNAFVVTTENEGRNERWNLTVQKEGGRVVRWRSSDSGRFLGEVTLRTTAEGSEITLAVDYEPASRQEEKETRRMVLPAWDVGGDLLRFRLYAEGVYEEQAEPAAVAG